MRLIRGFSSLQAVRRGGVATIGAFDSLHLGHQAVLARVCGAASCSARSEKTPTTVVLFEPLPQEFFSGGKESRLCSLHTRLSLLKAFGIDQVVCLRFDAKRAEQSAEAFVDEVLVQGLGVRRLVVGDDFRFGCAREGDFLLLRQKGRAHGFAVQQERGFMIDGHRVSSTRVREALAAGDFASARRLLGREYTVSGRVSHGDGRGKKLGFPTANLWYGRFLLPLLGVFAAEAEGIAGKPLPAVVNAGYRPVFQGKVYRFEVHIPGFSGDLYGRRLNVRLLAKIRDERSFDSTSQLQSAIRDDLKAAAKFWQRQ